LNLLALIMIFFLLPETKQRTLEELDYICTSALRTTCKFPCLRSSTVGVPTRTFAYYQLTKTLPYWFRRYIRMDKKAKLVPLYHFDRTIIGEGGGDSEDSKDPGGGIE
jgi:hypothetical protein